MKIRVEQIPLETEEEVSVKCHYAESEWVEGIRNAALGQRSVCGYKDGTIFQLKLSEIYYFEVVDGASFFYTKKEVFEAHEKLYEFEKISERSTLFRCSKSMILNAAKIDYIRPSFSGRFEAVLSNGETVMVSRKYVTDLKRLLGIVK